MKLRRQFRVMAPVVWSQENVDPCNRSIEEGTAGSNCVEITQMMRYRGFRNNDWRDRNIRKLVFEKLHRVKYNSEEEQSKFCKDSKYCQKTNYLNTVRANINFFVCVRAAYCELQCHCFPVSFNKIFLLYIYTKRKRITFL